MYSTYTQHPPHRIPFVLMKISVAISEMSIGTSLQVLAKLTPVALVLLIHSTRVSLVRQTVYQDRYRRLTFSTRHRWLLLSLVRIRSIVSLLLLSPRGERVSSSVDPGSKIALTA